jgi:hypothetical protein
MPALQCCLLLVPSEFALITVQEYLEDDQRSAVYRIADAWIPRLPLDLGLVSLVLMLAVIGSRFLPHGREAATASPLFGWTRLLPGEPRMASLFALLVATVLLAFGGFATVDAYHGFRALNGDGDVLTIGQDSHVTERRTSWRGVRTIFIDSSGNSIVAEGGRGQEGDRYGVFPPGSERSWYIGFGGWATDVMVAGLAVIFVGAAGFLVWLHLHQAQLRRRWLTSSRRPPRASVRPSVAVTYGIGVAVLVVTSTAFVINGQVADRKRFTTLQVPALAGHGMTTVLELTATRHRFGPIGTSMTPQPQHRVSVSGESLAVRGSDLGLSADVTRYANVSQALAAQQEYVAAATRRGLRHPLADGTAIIVDNDSGDTSVKKVTASAVRDRLLVTLEVRDPTGQPAAAGAVPLLYRQAPLIRDILAANASRIDEVSFPWWG